MRTSFARSFLVPSCYYCEKNKIERLSTKLPIRSLPRVVLSLVLKKTWQKNPEPSPSVRFICIPAQLCGTPCFAESCFRLVLFWLLLSFFSSSWVSGWVLFLGWQSLQFWLFEAFDGELATLPRHRAGALMHALPGAPGRAQDPPVPPLLLLPLLAGLVGQAAPSPHPAALSSVLQD